MINNSREDVTFDCTWSLGFARPVSGSKKVSLTTGQMENVPFRRKIPAGTPAGSYQLKLTATLNNGDVQQDSLVINVVADFKPPRMQGNAALFDPVGETARMLSAMGVQTSPVQADADLADYDTIIIGKKALTAYGPGPDISRVRGGLKVIVFEQTQEVLENRKALYVGEEAGKKHLEGTGLAVG